MKYGIFSDVHGNLEALEKVLVALEEARVDRYIFLGDIVGYGADPKACLRLLKDLIEDKGCLAVAGNHDHAVAGLTSSAHYAFTAQEAIEWTKKQLNAEETDFLAALKLRGGQDHFEMVHANFASAGNWEYVFDIDDAEASFQAFTKPLGFIGHSHKPMIFTAGEIVDWSTCAHVPIQKDVRYIVNVGSVGQPRDGDPRSAFALYDQEAGIVTIERVAYDIQRAQEKILAAGLPKILADRLAFGK